MFSDATKLVWFESPINPTLRCVDVAAIAAACRARGVISVIDNTFASPVNQQPLALGVDLVMHSATKYLNGHSDVTARRVAGPARLIAADREGAAPGGRRARSARRLRARPRAEDADVRMQRHNANAMAVAALARARHAASSQVYYPGLESHPDHAIARKQMRGFGGMVCLDLGGSFERATRFFDRLQRHQARGQPRRRREPVQPAGPDVAVGPHDEELERAGVTRGMARLSVGLEDADDLIADLDQALGSDR